MATQDQKSIATFLEKVTAHNHLTAKIRKSPSKNWTYSVRVEDKKGVEHKVNFYFWNEGSERFLAYGIAGWGTCAVSNVKDIEN